MSTSAQAIIDRAATVGIQSKLWEKGGKVRIYAQTDRRDMSIYLELDGTSDEVEGAALKVFCSTNQHANWVRSQVAAYREEYIGLQYASVVEQYSDLGPEPNGFGPSVNEMVDEARAFFAAREANVAA